MKLESLFTVKDNLLYKIEDNSLVDLSSLSIIKVSQAEVQIEEELYNEEYLASLREQLKVLEEQKKFAVLIPIPTKQVFTPYELEQFINTFNHTARRIKDCVSMIGYELPKQVLESPQNTQDFIQTLEKKHSQYIYFVKKDNAQELNLSLNMSYKEFVVW